jgi:hypothetical protein
MCLLVCAPSSVLCVWPNGSRGLRVNGQARTRMRMRMLGRGWRSAEPWRRGVWRPWRMGDEEDEQVERDEEDADDGEDGEDGEEGGGCRLIITGPL